MLTEDNPNAVVKDNILAPDTASYKAMVIVDTPYMTLSGAKKVLEFAQSGLPVVLSGQLPSMTKSYGEKESDAEIVSIIEDLLALDHVSYVETETEISEALKELGVEADVKPQTDQNKLSVIHRSLEQADYYYLFNRGYEETIETELTLKGSGTVYSLNAYNGDVTKLTNYEDGEGTVTVPVSIEARDTLMLAVSEDSYYSNGAKEDTPSGKVSRTAELTSWNLSLESWEPADDDVSSDEIVNDMQDLSRFDTNKVVYEEKLTEIIPWSDMEQYQDVSGIGTYTTTVTLDEEETGRKAILDLGSIYNCFEIYVNGEQVKGNLVTEKADLTEYLKAGENELRVVIPSEIMNTLIKVRANIYGERDRNVNGLTEIPVLTIY